MRTPPPVSTRPPRPPFRPLQPVVSRSTATPRHATIRRMRNPLLQPEAPEGLLLPAEHPEHFLLDRLNLLVRQDRIDDFVDRFCPGIAQPQVLLTVGRADILELQLLPPHQEQGNDVAEVHAGRFGLPL